jgi:hypothetical protein
MTELHDAFARWLAGGARDVLPRDIALHGSACPDCQRLVEAYDALTAVDPGAAPMPARGAARPRTGLVAAPAGRSVAAVGSLVLIAAAGFFAVNELRPSDPGIAAASGTPRGDVLGGQLEATPTPSPSDSHSVIESAGPSRSDSPSDEATPSATRPPMGGGPPPVGTPRPTPAASLHPTATATASARPSPSVSPTATPSPSPTPTATDTPTPTASPTPLPTETPPVETPAP